ncbi:hypothetical protein JZ751_027414 [Albula glossodonta]|uniref:Peptidase M12B domain-containing protein n=1 Tax=Albula glossodonta TaxID=121402 RepID=A0A8T2NG59_9TELE|nr:hypothetical protein JZ751_027414 [Albula glossodonta]
MRQGESTARMVRCVWKRYGRDSGQCKQNPTAQVVDCSVKSGSVWLHDDFNVPPPSPTPEFNVELSVLLKGPTSVVFLLWLDCNVGLRALLKGPTAMVFLLWLDWDLNHQPQGGSFFIEPVRGYKVDAEDGFQPHVVYRSSAGTLHRRLRRGTEFGEGQGACGLKDMPEESLQVEREREEWEQEQTEAGRPRRITQRSVSRERWVETMVVADSKLIDYHGSENVESYIFTIMNMVTGIFHDASIGNAVHIVLVRLILLPEDEKGLKIVHHADTTLSSFCTWQKNVNPQSDTHPAHHDVAVLITRQDFLTQLTIQPQTTGHQKDICAGMNKPCETLGLSHLSGMCQPHRSCNINEDSGLPVAFTVAHELGHRHPFIMSRQLKYDTSPLTWSPCSKEYITRFLDRGWGSCLDDRPSKKDLTKPLAAPGVRYTTHHQCQLQYGPNATFCQEVENVCQILWCHVNGSCRSKLDSPADGTRCGQDKWCISGECVIVGKLPETVNGGWGMWSSWSHCSRTCGAGVQAAERECNKPKPEFGGKYCTGERKRYRVCNTKPCVRQRPTFREMQCSEFDTVPYQNKLYEWVPVTNTGKHEQLALNFTSSHAGRTKHVNTATPCELHCRPVDERFSEKMLDAVTDGTPCFMNESRSICVNGVCKVVWQGMSPTLYSLADADTDSYGRVVVLIILLSSPLGVRVPLRMHSWFPCSVVAQNIGGYTDVRTEPCVHPLMTKLTSRGAQGTLAYSQKHKDVGCDYGIDSNAVEDRCGVCLGDGTTCQTVQRNFDEGEGVAVGPLQEPVCWGRGSWGSLWKYFIALLEAEVIQLH